MSIHKHSSSTLFFNLLNYLLCRSSINLFKYFFSWNPPFLETIARHFRFRTAASDGSRFIIFAKCPIVRPFIYNATLIPALISYIELQCLSALGMRAMSQRNAVFIFSPINQPQTF
jgi:hypothetical protein